tara:strand:- start:70 stop:423 length:354 start_codon:yes stop_codon:yes gene_type:complete
MKINKTLLFLIGCLGVRFGFAFLAKSLSLDFLKQISFIAVFPAIGFLYFYFTDTRRVGREAQGPIWWNKLRPIHAFMYLLFASYAFKKEKFAWMVLFVDACLGFLFWFMHYKLGFVF